MRSQATGIEKAQDGSLSYFKKLLPDDVDIVEFCKTHEIKWDEEAQCYIITLNEHVDIVCEGPDWYWKPVVSNAIYGVPSFWPPVSILTRQPRLLVNGWRDCLYLRALGYNAVIHPSGITAWHSSSLARLGGPVYTLWPSAHDLVAGAERKLSRLGSQIGVDVRHVRVGKIEGLSHGEVDELLSQAFKPKTVIDIPDIFATSEPEFSRSEHIPEKGFLRDFFTWHTNATDAPDPFAVAGGLFVLSVMMGKRFRVGMMYPNLFIMLIGMSGATRKTASQNLVDELLGGIEIESMKWHGEIHTKACRVRLPTQISLQAMYDELQERPFGAWFWGEAAGMMKQFTQQKWQAGSKEEIIRLYDRQTLDKRVRPLAGHMDGFQWYIPEPYVCIHGCCQREWITKYADWQDLISGFFPRFQCVLADERTRTIPLSKLRQPSEEGKEQLLAWLKELHAAHSYTAGIEWKWQNPSRVDAWYLRISEESQEHDEAVRPFLERMHDQFAKVALIYQASLDYRSEIISDEACHYAEKWCDLLINAAQRIAYPHTRNPQIKAAIHMHDYLQRYGSLTRTQLQRALRNHYKKDEFVRALEQALTAGWIAEELSEGEAKYRIRRAEHE